MSRIQSVNQNYQHASANLKQNPQKFGKNPSFGVAPEEFKGAAKEVYEICEKQTEGWFTKFGVFLAKNDNEIEKQLINAVFTATLAPLVIGYNPFSKQDEKTKKYMALRQPISAVVAIAGGIAMTKPIDEWLVNVANEGNTKSLDLRMSPDKDYVKRFFNKEYKAAPDKAAFLETFKAEKVEKGLFKDWRYKSNCLDKYVKTYQDKLKETFSRLIAEKPENLFVNEVKGENNEINSIIEAVKRDDEGNIISRAEIGRNIPNMNSQDQLNEYLDSNNLHKMSLKDFAEKNLGFEFYEDGKLKPQSLDKKLRETKAKAFLEGLGIKGFDGEALDKILAEMSSEKHGVSEKLSKGMTRTAQRAVGKTKNDAITVEQLFHHLGYVVEGTNKCSIDKIQKLMDCTVSEAFEILKHGGKGTPPEGILAKVNGLAGLELGKGEKLGVKNIIDLSKNIIEADAKKLGTKFKAYKGYAGILSNLVIVVITCTALNWIYPRLVEALFPSLVKDDKAVKGGNK